MIDLLIAETMRFRREQIRQYEIRLKNLMHWAEIRELWTPENIEKMGYVACSDGVFVPMQMYREKSKSSGRRKL